MGREEVVLLTALAGSAAACIVHDSTKAVGW